MPANHPTNPLPRNKNIINWKRYLTGAGNYRQSALEVMLDVPPVHV
jgi:hypothetical protein